jgi:hypothetical protein
VGLLPILLASLVLPLPASAKVLNRAVLVGSDGRAVEVRGAERDFDGLARDPRAEPRPVRGGYLRLFFVGPGDFPANPARYASGEARRLPFARVGFSFARAASTPKGACIRSTAACGAGSS